MVALPLLVRQSQVLHLVAEDGQLLVIRTGLEHGVGVAEARSLSLSLGEPSSVNHRLLQQPLEPRDDPLLHLDRRAALADPRRLALALLKVPAQLRVRLLQLEVPTLELLRLDRLLVHSLESVHELGVASLLLRVPRRELTEPIFRLHQVVDAVQAQRLQPGSRVRVALLVQQPPELRVVTLQALPGRLSLLVPKLEVLNPALGSLQPRERVVQGSLLVNHVRRHGAQHPGALAADAEPAAGVESSLNLLLPGLEELVTRPHARGDGHPADLLAAAHQGHVVQRARLATGAEVIRGHHRAANHTAAVVQLEHDRGAVGYGVGRAVKRGAVTGRPQRRARQAAPLKRRHDVRGLLRADARQRLHDAVLASGVHGSVNLDFAGAR